ncbi:MFS general substrate transporter [Eremomyces bilateralis CBS 781.70]|uniref:MFS general substrate transporter n=1 Tax=Eremomyces bilateralis CBS 781.70 TaxID=1392243 RepID=A0A6G1GGE9_9PEZI|nr:MFS general substrate transporter [Eremomyces bilateralis CBS 781.70]KAF1816949.1 MFS general substrate transporter [Eremomyces bilateralis CBS 781.70]
MSHLFNIGSWCRRTSRTSARQGQQKHEALGLPGHELAAQGGENQRPEREDGKVELTEDDAASQLGYAFPKWKKVMILITILCIQISINSNASMYGWAMEGIADRYDISQTKSRLGQSMFLIAYAFGCELWAPWSEEIGRWPTQQLSLFLVNMWQILCALSPTFGGVLTGRILGGLSTAGGSVTLGVIADIYHPEDSGFQYAVAFVVLSSVGGAPLGAMIGGFVFDLHEDDPSWIFWVLLIMGGVVQIAHFFLVPETRATVILDHEARRRRKSGKDPNVYGPNELKEHRFSFREILRIWWRPFEMLLTEPIVLWLSLLSGFSDSLIFTFMEAFGPIFDQWGFEPWQRGLCFLSSLVGYFIAYLCYLPVIWHHNKKRAHDPDSMSPESRLWFLLFLAPGLFLGLLGFAFTSLGPPNTPWIAPLLFNGLVGMSNYAIYKSTIDYMMAAYGPYAASATGGNDFARDLLAGIAGLYAHPFYRNIDTYPRWTLSLPTIILAAIAIPVTIPIYIFYHKGPNLRLESKFAEELEKARRLRLSKKGEREPTEGKRGAEQA